MLDPKAVVGAVESILAGLQGLAAVEAVGMTLNIPGFVVAWTKTGVRVTSVGTISLEVVKEEGK